MSKLLPAFSLLLPFVACLGLSSAASAETKSIQLAAGQSKALAMCNGDRGTVTVKQQGEQIQIAVKNSTCSKLDIYAAPGSDTVVKTYELKGTTMPRSASFTLPKSVTANASSVELRLRSNSGKHADWMQIALAPQRSELALGSQGTLQACGGSIKVSHGMNAGKPQVNVVLKNVENCGEFTVESNNGRSIQKSYKVTGGKAGSRSASYTLSWNKVIDKGNWGFAKNDINVKVHGQSTQDLFVVSFLASK